MTGPSLRRAHPGAGRALFLLFTNPAGYPPVEHAVRLMAEAGWDIRIIGTGADGTGALELPRLPGVELVLLPRRSPGWAQKVQYAGFALRATELARRWRPDIIHASDPLSTPAALLAAAAAGAPIVYHEHDAPGAEGRGGADALVRRARARVLRTAALCVAPGEARACRLRDDGRPAHLPTVVAWNTPVREEVQLRPPPRDGPLTLHYHGSVVPQRVPTSVVDAVALLGGAVQLRIVGYETAGSPGYGSALEARAVQRGIPGLVRFEGPLPLRRQLLERARAGDVGLSVVTDDASDSNLRSLVGPSNKPFDYLASGLPLIVPAREEWVETFVRPGVARPCDPSDPVSIAAAVRWFLDHPDERRAMGERGQGLIRDRWCYELQFAPVLERCERLRAMR